MGAKRLGVSDIDRLFKLTDQVGGVEQRLLHGGRVAGVGPEIAIPDLAAGMQGCSAAEIDDDIGFLDDAVLCGLELQRVARGGLHHRTIIDCCLERAERTRKGPDTPAHHGVAGHRRRHGIARRGEQDADIKPGGKLRCRLDRTVALAIDKDTSLRTHRNRPCRFGLDRGGGDQGGDLRGRRAGLFRPAGRLANIYIGNTDVVTGVG